MKTTVKETFDSLLQEFLGARFTGHGFIRFHSSPVMGGAFRRWFWLLVGFTMAGIGLWQVTKTSLHYMSRPTISTIEVTEPDELPFPSVQICPLSPIRADRVRSNNPSNSAIQQQAVDDAGFRMLLEFDEALQKLFFESLGFSQMSREFCYGVSEASSQMETTQPDLSPNFAALMKKFGELAYFVTYFGTEGDTRAAREAAKKLNLTGDWSAGYFKPQDQIYNVSKIDEKDFIGLLFSRGSDEFYASLCQRLVSFQKVFQRKLEHEISSGAITDPTFNVEQESRFLEFHITDVINTCFFMGKNCMDELYWAPHPTLQRCFVFNHQYLNKGQSFLDEIRVRTSGREMGLKLNMNIRKDSYIEAVGRNPIPGGFTVDVTDSRTASSGISDSFVFSGGSTIDLRVSRTEVYRLDPHDNGKCSPNDHFHHLFPHWTILGEYSKSACNELKKFEKCLTKCGCVSGSTVPFVIKNFTSLFEGVRVCDYMDKPCQLRVEVEVTLSSLCSSACKQVIYTTSVTRSPLDINAAVKVEAVETSRHAKKFCGSSGNGEVASFTKEPTMLNIFYHTLDVPVHKESYVYYNFMVFLGNIGGMLGLFLGASLITIMEFLEFGLDGLILTMSKLFCISKNKNEKRRSIKERSERQKTCDAGAYRLKIPAEGFYGRKIHPGGYPFPPGQWGSSAEAQW